MRPDRIVVGECRGGEALDMLQAMNTGHDGSLTTTHANSPREALARLETLVLMAGVDLPARAIREQIASSVHLIVQQSRLSDGSAQGRPPSARSVGLEPTRARSSSARSSSSCGPAAPAAKREVSGELRRHRATSPSFSRTPSSCAG